VGRRKAQTARPSPPPPPCSIAPISNGSWPRGRGGGVSRVRQSIRGHRLLHPLGDVIPFSKMPAEHPAHSPRARWAAVRLGRSRAALRPFVEVLARPSSPPGPSPPSSERPTPARTYRCLVLREAGANHEVRFVTSARRARRPTGECSAWPSRSSGACGEGTSRVI
jgi:hypothetical protein